MNRVTLQHRVLHPLRLPLRLIRRVRPLLQLVVGPSARGGLLLLRAGLALRVRGLAAGVGRGEVVVHVVGAVAGAGAAEEVDEKGKNLGRSFV